ncbi:MAG: DUF1573 domain-containing protein [Bacteroidales bacterium]|nr:DUF1573 domain-containing protein [Bacteroidales bacterium]
MKKIILAVFMIASAFSLFAQGAPSIIFDSQLHDFGTISEENGSVSCEFQFTNNGDAPLVVNRVTASCGCTTPDWTKEPVAPGKTGFIKATYAAKGRPGAFSKTITVFSNAKEGNVMLNIKGNVVPKTASIEDQYPFSISDLRLKSFLLAMYDVSTKGVKSDRMEMYNSGSTPISIHFDKVPSHITIVANPVVLQPKAKGDIVVTYKGNSIKDWGSRTDDIFVLLNNETRIASDRKIVVSANLVEDFSTMTPAQRESAGRIAVSSAVINLGLIKSGEKKVQSLSIQNTGKTALQIRKVSSASAFLVTKIDKMSIPAGQKANLKVTLIPSKVRNALNESVSIVTNDPSHPVTIIQVTGSI